MTGRPRETTIDRVELLRAFNDATVTFGDCTGRWRSTQDLADRLWVDYGRCAGALHHLAEDGLVIRQAEGAAYWQRTHRGTTAMRRAGRPSS